MKILFFFYFLLSLPAYVCYKLNGLTNKLIIEDFKRNREFHAKKDVSEYFAFVHMMQTMPEYRFVLYNRMPVFMGAILNLILRKRRVYFNVETLMGGGRSYTWLVNDCICEENRQKF